MGIKRAMNRFSILLGKEPPPKPINTKPLIKDCNNCGMPRNLNGGCPNSACLNFDHWLAMGEKKSCDNCGRGGYGCGQAPCYKNSRWISKFTTAV